MLRRRGGGRAMLAAGVAAGISVGASVGPGAAALAQRADAPFTGNLIPQGSPIPRVLPPELPDVAAGPVLSNPVAVAPAGSAVRVRDVVVEGATAFPDRRTRPLLDGLVGPAVPVRRIETARAALLMLYRRHGYLLTTVNARLDSAGVLRFSVIEGHVVEVKLDGNIGPAGVQVLRFLRHLTAEPVLSNAALERWLLLAQDIPGVTVHAVLRPTVDDPGALVLVAQVSRQAANGLLTADNRATRLTGPQEGLVVLDGNSFTQFGERTELSVFHTSGNTQNFGQASEDLFVGGSGLHVRLYGGYGKATPSDFLRAIDYQGFTTTFGIAATYPLIRSRSQTLNLSADLDAVETEIRADNNADVVARTSRDSLRVGRLQASYALEDGLAGAARPATNALVGRLSQGLPFLGGTDDRNPLPGRAGEQVGFTAFSFELSRLQTLFAPWQGATVSFRGRLLGQATPDTLPPSEQYFLGGTDIGRGYYSGQVTGDDALAESAELDLDAGTRPSVWGHVIALGAQFYLFYDHGQTWENKNTAPNATISSEGAGARFNITRFLEFDLEGDLRDVRVPVGSAATVQKLPVDVGYWRVLARF